jgi:hypothetical protein
VDILCSAVRTLHRNLLPWFGELQSMSLVTANKQVVWNKLTKEELNTVRVPQICQYPFGKPEHKAVVACTDFAVGSNGG